MEGFLAVISKTGLTARKVVNGRIDPDISYDMLCSLVYVDSFCHFFCNIQSYLIRILQVGEAELLICRITKKLQWLWEPPKLLCLDVGIAIATCIHRDQENCRLCSRPTQLGLQ